MQLLMQWLAFLSAFSTETFSVLRFLQNAEGTSALWQLGLLHGAACLLVALPYGDWLDVFYPQSSSRQNRVAVFIVAFCLPVFGIACTALMLTVGSQKKLSQAASALAGVDDRLFELDASVPLKQNSAQEPAVTQEKLHSILNNSTSYEKRLTAVMSTLRLRDREAIAVLRKALGDGEDDVRLLAYALMEKKERDITRQLHECLQNLEALRPHERYGLHRRSAMLYWEFAHMGLADGEILDYYLDECLAHARNAVALDARAPGMHLLIGKVSLRKGHYDEAERAFRIAADCGFDSSVIDNYLEEIEYHRSYNVSAHVSDASTGVSDQHWA